MFSKDFWWESYTWVVKPSLCLFFPAGDDKQPGSGLLSGAPARLRGPHSERRFFTPYVEHTSEVARLAVSRAASTENSGALIWTDNIPVWLLSSWLMPCYAITTEHSYVTGSSKC